MRIFIATGNAHKTAEFAEMFSRAQLECEVLGADALGGMPHCEEDGASFEENAFIKADALKKVAPEASYVLADDSGLAVDALGGRPGIHSARYAGIGGSSADSSNNEKLLRELESVPDAERTARFVCALALICPGGERKIFRGEFEGVINRGAKGAGGFGYDPLFFVPERGCTSAELSARDKNEISHRGLAFAKLVEYLKACV